MKKKLFSLLLIAAVAFVGVSCSDDDDDDNENGNGNGNGNNTEKINEKVDGAYNGTMDIIVDGTTAVEDFAQKIYITKIADTDDKVKLEIRDFSFGPMKLGTITVDNTKVTESGDKYVLDGSATIELSLVGNCDVKVGGDILKDSKCNFIIDVKVLSGVMKDQIIKVDFTGQREAAK